MFTVIRTQAGAQIGINVTLITFITPNTTNTECTLEPLNVIAKGSLISLSNQFNSVLVSRGVPSSQGQQPPP